MPAWRLKLVMQYEIADVSEKSGSPLSADYRVLGPSNEGGSVVLVAMAKDERVQEWVQAFAQAKLEVVAASPLPVALADSYRFLGEDAGTGTTMVLDVGRSSTEVGLVDDGKLMFARSVAAGGDAITERIQKKWDLERADAERAKLKGKTPDGDPIDDAIRPGIQQLSSLVKASIEFARAQLKLDGIKVMRVAVAGGAARTKGLVEALGEAASTKATLFDPIAAIDTHGLSSQDKDDVQDHSLEAAAAIGVALGQVLPTANALDLLPNAVKAARTFRHRTIWLRVAAVVLGVAAAFGLGSAYFRNRAELEQKRKLAKVRDEVSARLEALHKLEEENQGRARAVAAVANRARPGFHLASLVASLAREIPPKASVTEITVALDKDTGGLRWEVLGEADNAQKDVDQTMRKLESGLSRDPDISSAKIEPLSTLDAPVVRWKLTIAPNMPQPEAKKED